MKLWNSNNIEITSDYVINGNKGLKITVSGSANFIGPQIDNFTNYAGKILKFSADISNPNFDVRITFKQYNGSMYTDTQATTIKRGSSTHAIVSATILDDTEKLWLRIESIYGEVWPVNGVFYTDNWCLEEITG